MKLKRTQLIRNFQIGLMGPVNEKATPDHDDEKRNVQPVANTQDKMMLLTDSFFHEKTL
jgi:hypothetical protein